MLSWIQLYKDYLKEMTKADVRRKTRLVRIADILKEKGMLELSADGAALEVTN